MAEQLREVSPVLDLGVLDDVEKERTMKKRELTIPTILGIITAIGGLVAGIILLNKPLRSLVGAAAEEAPSQIKMTNITDSSFVVSWITTKSTSGYVQYGEKITPN